MTYGLRVVVGVRSRSRDLPSSYVRCEMVIIEKGVSRSAKVGKFGSKIVGLLAWFLNNINTEITDR